ncbi:hypothetical protein HO133_006212 [Letharia lupina]|uniref:Uncharacterized protein n=1 Tax=Letharia lupina TaxID=560253 RepID=A0A8H6C777_9LECA|nr:uncharacterized protein HO133_006212 [Letharia lupina]KAF6218250.1 hypothetical protein HO133_006212 [Letharia lupina]
MDNTPPKDCNQSQHEVENVKSATTSLPATPSSLGDIPAEEPSQRQPGAEDVSAISACPPPMPSVLGDMPAEDGKERQFDIDNASMAGSLNPATMPMTGLTPQEVDHLEDAQCECRDFEDARRSRSLPILTIEVGKADSIDSQKTLTDDVWIPQTPSPEKYTGWYSPPPPSPPLDLSSTTQHHLCIWFLSQVEQSFYGKAEAEFQNDLESLKWKQDLFKKNPHQYSESYLNKKSEKYAESELIEKPWHLPDRIEPEYWVEFFKYAGKLLPCDAYDLPADMSRSLIPYIFEKADTLRHITNHRDRTLYLWTLTEVMKIPRILKDYQRADEMNLVFRVVREDPSVDEYSRSVVQKFVLTADKPCTTYLQISLRVESLMEEGIFRYAKRENPEFLKEKGWCVPEDADLRDWFWAWTSPPFQPAFDRDGENLALTDVDGRLFSQHDLRNQVLDGARDLRSSTAHRDELDEWSLRADAWNGILLMKLCDDQEQAVLIEAYAEAFLTERSILDVLSRLEKDSANDDSVRRDAIVRVNEWSSSGCDPYAKQIFYARKRVRANGTLLKQGRWWDVDHHNGESSTCQMISSGSRKAQRPRRDSDELCALHQSAVEAFVFADSMHPALKLSMEDPSEVTDREGIADDDVPPETEPVGADLQQEEENPVEETVEETVEEAGARLWGTTDSTTEIQYQDDGGWQQFEDPAGSEQCRNCRSCREGDCKVCCLCKTWLIPEVD